MRCPSAPWLSSRTARPTSGCAAPPHPAPSSSPPSGSCRATKRSMRTCSVRDVLRLVRAHNLVVAAAGVLAGGWVALGALATPKLLGFAPPAAGAVGAGGHAVDGIWGTAPRRVDPRPGGGPPPPGPAAR